MTDYADRQSKIKSSLESALQRAEEAFSSDHSSPRFEVTPELKKFLKKLSDKAGSASAAFTNVVTGLAIKAAYPDIDVRHHQIQIQDPLHFNHRGESESVIYPWLSSHDFDGAKSGWQTRTLERPKPYTLEYDENIAHVKKEFLGIYDLIETAGESADDALAQILYFQVIDRNKKKINLIEPNIDDISIIVMFFRDHFFAKYSTRGASRLPVLALHSLYKLVIPQLSRFEGLDLAQLELHSAADSQTGATGDIEVKKKDGSVFEAIEVKHNISIDENLVNDVAKKLAARKVERYYILTTHSNCGATPEIQELCGELRERTGCQIIANGVVPTLKYYLRLVKNPSEIFPLYVELLKIDSALSHEHRAKWNDIVLKPSVS